MAKLGEVCKLNMGQSPDSSSYNDTGDGIPFFQGNADFGEAHPNIRVWCNAPTKIAHPGEILISVRAPIGAMNIADCECCIGRGLASISADEAICTTKYLWYGISSKIEELNAKGTGSTFKAINKKTLEETEIPIRDLIEQERIAANLDRVTALISLRKQQLAKLDELVKARFVEMFGEPVQNPNCWKTENLLDLGYCKNGMNFHRDDCGTEIHCLGVGDFKNHSTIRDVGSLPFISLNELPTSEYLLQDGDIVFVRSNGNKELVGRCLAIYPAKIPVTYSGFCIRYSLTSNKITVSYLLRVLKADSVRKKMMGRGANIQNLNQQILAQLVVPIPPLSLQNQFATFVERVDQQKRTVQQSFEKLELMKKALMQEYFG